MGTHVNAAFLLCLNDNLDSGVLARALLQTLNLSTVALVRTRCCQWRLLTYVYLETSQ